MDFFSENSYAAFALVLAVIISIRLIHRYMIRRFAFRLAERKYRTGNNSIK